MEVGGEDDLATLATSFNDMAANLQGKIRQLEDLSRVQQRFVSDVSHELRTPLTTIRMAGDLLLESREDFDPARGRSAELLHNQLDRFEALLIDLLEISRFDAGAAALDVDPVDVRDLVAACRSTTRSAGRAAGSRIEFRLPATGCFAEIDPRRVERILRNLLVNAVEHGEGKDVVVTVRVDRRRGRRLGPRPRRRPAAGRGAAGLQPVLARRPGPGPHHRRHRPGPGHRPRGRAAARRLAAGLGRARRGLGLPADPAPGGRSWLAGSPLPLGPDEAELPGFGVADSYPAGEAGEVASRG